MVKCDVSARTYGRAMSPRVTAPEFATLGLDDWRYLGRTLQATFRLTSYAEAGAFAARIAATADRLDHHPAVDVRYPGDVHVVTTSHDVHAVTDRDIALARAISELAVGASVVSQPREAQLVDIGVDAADIDAVRPFWKALLAYADEPPAVEGDTVRAIRDPRDTGPTLWFQQIDPDSPAAGLDPNAPQRHKTHLDVWLSHDVAEQRIADALAAGGRLVSDQQAKAFWVLADPEGNEACICTWQDRD